LGGQEQDHVDDFRRPEIVGLNMADLKFPKNGGLLATLRRSKTDQTGKGRTVAVELSVRCLTLVHSRKWDKSCVAPKSFPCILSKPWSNYDDDPASYIPSWVLAITMPSQVILSSGRAGKDLLLKTF
jgi:hypothetical protein